MGHAFPHYKHQDIRNFLEDQVSRINRPKFIHDDPICIPKRFNQLQDIEITAFWVAMLAWGQRKTIISKMEELIRMMDGEPYKFILDHTEQDRRRFEHFRHRTFQYTDTLFFLEFFQNHYRKHDSLEEAFSGYPDIKTALTGFHEYFFSSPLAPVRTRKHVATPARKSACKRLNMFLRWMVRHDDKGVDFGLWRNISPAVLMIPLDVHVARVAEKLGLLQRKQKDWMAVEELTATLRKFDPSDPVKYDFALYGLGVLGEF